MLLQHDLYGSIEEKWGVTVSQSVNVNNILMILQEGTCDFILSMSPPPPHEQKCEINTDHSTLWRSGSIVNLSKSISYCMAP